MRWGATLVHALLWLAIAASPAAARQEAYILLDHATGTVLDASHADEPAYPASLTKMMTLFLTFRALEAGQIDLTSRLRVSERAAAMPPTKLGLKAGGSIAVEDAILGLITRSANDAAAVLGENLGGSEDRFALLMTRTARQLGMTNTVFRNASGLPDDEQHSTARDLARLSTRLISDYPKYYRYFSRRSFVYGGRTIPNHNHLMQSYAGMDGLKTGYTRVSGFNLAASAVRGGRRLVAVVMGGPTAYARDEQMRDLLEAGFKKLGRERPAPALVAEATPERLPQLKPTLVALEEGDGPDAADPDEAELAAVTPAVVAGIVPAVAVSSALATGTTRKPARKLVATASVPDRATAMRLAKAKPVRAAAVKQPAKATAPAKAVANASRAAGLPYGIQVGAFQRPTLARQAAKQAVATAPEALRGTFVSVGSQVVQRKTLYRATLMGLARDEADQVCRKLKRQGQACLVVRTGPLAMASR